jgi:hypothetical protein
MKVLAALNGIRLLKTIAAISMSGRKRDIA